MMKLWLKMVTSVILILLSLLLASASGISCQDSETTSSEPTTGVETRAFIWKVSSDTTHVYLLGSVHIASRDLYPLDKTIEDAFDFADYLVVEINTNDIDQSAATQLVLDYGTYPEGDGFKKNVPEDLYNKLEDFFLQYGTAIGLLDTFRPFVIYNLMSQLMLESLGYSVEYGIDFYFLDKAEIENKNILELETAEYQIELLSSIPDECIIAAMEYDIENPETGKYLEEIFNAWQEGDAAKLETILFEALDEEPDMMPYYEMIYNQRNLEMAQKIEGFLANDEVYFIVVGAGHLVGEDGIIYLLENREYDVEQLYESG